VSPREAAEEVVSFCKTSKDKVAVIFGREDRGLTNEELGLCNLHVHIPSSDEYPSLNLSQAIQIIAYEIRLKALSNEGKLKKQEWDVPLAENAEIERLIEHFDELMQEVEFYETDNPRQLLTRVRRFFKRSKLDHMEANIFRGVFAAIQKKLKR
jgi:tRNA (cytidine32/uridine32-2'-O)-methyltransferase